MGIANHNEGSHQLTRSDDPLRLLLDTTPALIHTGLPDGSLDFFNRRWLEYVGLSLTDLLGWRWTNAIHPEDVGELVAAWRAALETGEPLEAESRVRCRMGKRIDAVTVATMEKLERWSWPGNVRELENLVHRSVILTSGNTLAVSLSEKMNGAIDAAQVVGNFEEQERIVSILKETKGRVSGPNGAASRLGVKRSTLLDRMKKLGINTREVKSDFMYSQASVD